MPILGAEPLDRVRRNLAGRGELLPAPLTKRSGESVDLANGRRRHGHIEAGNPLRVCREPAPNLKLHGLRVVRSARDHSRGCRRLERRAARSAVATCSIHAGRLCARSATRACTTSSDAARSGHPPSTTRAGPMPGTSTTPSTRPSARRCRDLSLASARASCRTCVRLVLPEHAGGVPRVPRAAGYGAPARSRRHTARGVRDRAACDRHGADPHDQRHAQTAAHREQGGSANGAHAT